MKITQQLIQALEEAFHAQAKVDRLVAQIENKADGRRNRPRKTRRKAKPKAE